MFFSGCVGIDMGSSNTRVYSGGKGVVFNQPTMIAVRGSESEVLGMGDSARDLVRCASVGISILRPVIGGVIADWELAKIMHRSLFFGQKHNSNEEMKPDSIETEIFKILRILKSMKKAEDKDLIINLLDDISLFLDENV